MNTTLTGLFTLECAMKIYSYGFRVGVEPWVCEGWYNMTAETQTSTSSSFFTTFQTHFRFAQPAQGSNHPDDFIFQFQLIQLLLTLSSGVTPSIRSTWWRPSVGPSLYSLPWRVSWRSLPLAGGLVVRTPLCQCSILMFKQDHFLKTF